MNPLLVIGVPITLMIIGMVLNSFGLSFDQPPSSSEQDPAKRLAAERDGYRQFFRSPAKRRFETAETDRSVLVVGFAGNCRLLHAEHGFERGRKSAAPWSRIENRQLTRPERIASPH